MQNRGKIIVFKPKQVNYTDYKIACDNGLRFITIVAVGIIVMLTLLMWTMLQGIR